MEQKQKILYLVLGIGMGIIVASTLYSIYPKVEYVQLSDDMVIERARDLGMVSLKENIKMEKEIDDNPKQEDEIVQVEEPVIEPEPVIETEIRIEYGWSLTRVATELYEKEVINNKEEFMDFVKGKKLSASIRVGTYKMKNNSSYDEIMEMITTRPK